MDQRSDGFTHRFALLIVSTAIGFAINGGCYLQHSHSNSANDLYATIPFHPKVTYENSNVVITNPEEEPYFDMSLRVYIGSTLYMAGIGTLQPGESKTCPMSSLVNSDGDSFVPGAPKTSELEIRARFRGYDDHKDFPPPR